MRSRALNAAGAAHGLNEPENCHLRPKGVHMTCHFVQCISSLQAQQHYGCTVRCLLLFALRNSAALSLTVRKPPTCQLFKNSLGHLGPLGLPSTAY